MEFKHGFNENAFVFHLTFRNVHDKENEMMSSVDDRPDLKSIVWHQQAINDFIWIFNVHCWKTISIECGINGTDDESAKKKKKGRTKTLSTKWNQINESKLSDDLMQ